MVYELVRSDSIWERRTAILAALYFVRKGATEKLDADERERYRAL